MAGTYFSQVVENKMNFFSAPLYLLIILFILFSCASTEDSSGTNKELDHVLDQSNSTDERSYLDLPEIPSSSCYFIDSSTIDNSTVDN